MREQIIVVWRVHEGKWYLHALVRPEDSLNPQFTADEIEGRNAAANLLPGKMKTELRPLFSLSSLNRFLLEDRS